MQPELSMIKFRLPWKDGKTLYPDGHIYMQPFPGPSSTETRLIFKKHAKIITYDNTQYEQHCFYHNTVIKFKYFNHKLGLCTLEKDDIDNCYDCASLVYIANEYLELFNVNITLKKFVNNIISKSSVYNTNILQKTYKSFEDIIYNVICHVFERCEDETCKICKWCNVDRNKKTFKSNATEENYFNALKLNNTNKT